MSIATGDRDVGACRRISNRWISCDVISLAHRQHWFCGITLSNLSISTAAVRTQREYNIVNTRSGNYARERETCQLRYFHHGRVVKGLGHLDHVWNYGLREVVSSIPDRGNIVGCNYRPSASFLYEVASHVNQLPFRPLLLLLLLLLDGRLIGVNESPVVAWCVCHNQSGDRRRTPCNACEVSRLRLLV